MAVTQRHHAEDSELFYRQPTVWDLISVRSLSRVAITSTTWLNPISLTRVHNAGSLISKCEGDSPDIGREYS